MAITQLDKSNEEIEVDDAGVWITIAGHSVKVRVIDGLLAIDAWTLGNEDGEPIGALVFALEE